MICVAGDENAWEYGFNYQWWFDDYYCMTDDYDEDEGTFTFNYCGVEYPDCKFVFEISGEGWLEEEQYGWERTNTKYYTISVLLPIGADGYCGGLYDSASDCWNIEFDENYWGQIPSEEYLFFRFQ